MARRSTRHSSSGDQLEFSNLDPIELSYENLLKKPWPQGSRFPLNLGKQNVRSHIWQELVSASSPLLVTGFASLDLLIRFASQWSKRRVDGPVRILIGNEPFVSSSLNFKGPRATLSQQMMRYWVEERRISIAGSHLILLMLELIKDGRVQIRTSATYHMLHAKIYLADDAATLGSSNFTKAGLESQIEANVRFDRWIEPDRFGELSQVAEILWTESMDFSGEVVKLLESLLSIINWEEALALACADLLEGSWAKFLLATLNATSDKGGGSSLWPSQIAGIAEALWVIDHTGSVLVADATGSGKTRMGAYLTKIVRDQLWSSGRAVSSRGSQIVLVAPPKITKVWASEALKCGLQLEVVSHGKLSRSSGSSPGLETLRVRSAQILAVDEAHNFLNQGTKRTDEIRDSPAEHVLLFTATPISRGASDILSLVGLLGADNFEDETLQILERLAASSVERMDVETRAILRNEIQRFTVRRTKAQFNVLVDQEPELYPTRIGGRTCRYPIHNLRSYASGETEGDIAIAHNIVRLTSELIGIAFLEEKVISPPEWSKQSQKTWLERRLSASRGLAAYDILSTLRSSRPALVEHILGTRQAEAMFDILQKKVQSNAGMIEKLQRAIQVGPPQVSGQSTIPEWLASHSQWTLACQAEMAIYQEIAELAGRMSSARELGKVKVLVELKNRHDRVIAFDRRPITLHYLGGILAEQNEEFLLATGQGGEKAKERIEVSFGMDSKVKAIALCSDALNEGLNLQGASAVVHLDIPTTLRVAEQRVGRVDRIDSPYDEIDVYWPSDGEAFLTNDDRRIAIRAIENDHLLGSNIPVPFAKGLDLTINPDDFDASEVFDSEELDLTDAFEPVRRLVGGENPLIRDRTYVQATRSAQGAKTIISVVESDIDWVFLSIEGAKSAIPRWMFIELSDGGFVSHTLGDVSERIRHKLCHHDPAQAGGELDERASEVLDSAIRVAQKQEFKLLPRRQQKAYQQMLRMVDHWAMQASKSGAINTVDSWKRIASALKGPFSEAEGGVIPDFAELARCWIRLVQPRIDGHQARKRKKYVVLSDIEESLQDDPISLAEMESALQGLEMCAPLASRIKVAIVGVGTGFEF